MTPTIHTALVTNLKTNVKDVNGNPLFKTVELWNNQVEHLSLNDNDDKPRLLPGCFIEYAEVQNKSQNSRKMLMKNFKIVLHIVYHSLKDNDASYLDTKQQCYKYVQWFENGTCSKFLWDSEIYPTDYGNLRWCQQIYKSTLKDLDAMTLPNSGTVGNMTTTAVILPNI